MQILLYQSAYNVKKTLWIFSVRCIVRIDTVWPPFTKHIWILYMEWSADTLHCVQEHLLLLLNCDTCGTCVFLFNFSCWVALFFKREATKKIVIQCKFKFETVVGEKKNRLDEKSRIKWRTVNYKCVVKLMKKKRTIDEAVLSP